MQQNCITMGCTPETAKLAAMDPIIKTFSEDIIPGHLRVHLHTSLGWDVGIEACPVPTSLSSDAFLYLSVNMSIKNFSNVRELPVHADMR